MIKNEQLPLEKELYDAWCAFYDMPSGLSEEQAGRISTRCNAAYERAYEELGPRWTQHVIGAARRDSGEDI